MAGGNVRKSQGHAKAKKDRWIVGKTTTKIKITGKTNKAAVASAIEKTKTSIAQEILG